MVQCKILQFLRGLDVFLAGGKGWGLEEKHEP